MAGKTKRRFTDEFKREAVALWETSGRMQTEVAAELGIIPTMLRRWQRRLQEGGTPPASPAAKPPVSTMTSPADQASEIARLRQGWLYLAAVLDLATRKIVGWAMRDHMHTELPLAALIMAAQAMATAQRDDVRAGRHTTLALDHEIVRTVRTD